jgi:hypothetical protein
LKETSFPECQKSFDRPKSLLRPLLILSKESLQTLENPVDLAYVIQDGNLSISESEDGTLEGKFHPIPLDIIDTEIRVINSNSSYRIQGKNLKKWVALS